MGSSPVIPPLPPGFTLDRPQTAPSLPPLPPGFTLDRTPSMGDILIEGAQSVPPDSAPMRFLSGLWKNINPVSMAKGAYRAVTSPVQTGGAIVGQMGEHLGQARLAVSEGRYQDALGQALYGSVPLIGPAFGAADARARTGDIAGALGEATGILAGPKIIGGAAGVVGKIAQPLASKVSPQIASAAARVGVEMPASALSESKLVPLAESLSAKGIGGRATAARFDAATAKLTEAADALVQRSSNFPDASTAGHVIAKGLDDYKARWMSEKANLYAAAEVPERGIRVQPTETVALLESIISEKRRAAGVLGDATNASFYQRIYDGLTREVQSGRKKMRVIRDVEARDLLAANRDLGQKVRTARTDPFAAAEKGNLLRVSATLDREFRAALDVADPALAQRLRAADAAYQAGIQKINSTFGKRINDLAKEQKFDKIAGAIANPRVSVDDIPRIMEVVGTDGAEAIRTAVLADVVGQAKNASGKLTPQGLGRAMRAYGDDRLAALLTPEQIQNLRELSTLTGSLEKGTRVMNGSQTAFIARIGGYPTWFWADPINATLALAGDAAMSRFIASRAGQRWLTTGWSMATPGARTATVAIASAQIGQRGATERKVP